MTKLAMLPFLITMTAFAEHGPYPRSDRQPWTPPGRPGTPIAQGIPAAACFQKRSGTLKEVDNTLACLDALKKGANDECEQKAKADCNRAENQANKCTYSHTRFPGSWGACEAGSAPNKTAVVCNWYCTDLPPRKPATPTPTPKKD